MIKELAAIVLLAYTLHGAEVNVKLVWEQDTEVDSWTVYYGTNSANYSSAIDVSRKTCVVSNLPVGATYYFTVVPVKNGFEGEQSDELVVTVEEGELDVVYKTNKFAVISFDAQKSRIHEIQYTEDNENWKVLKTFRPNINKRIKFVDRVKRLRLYRLFIK
jgi:hypothetical protein